MSQDNPMNKWQAMVPSELEAYLTGRPEYQQLHDGEAGRAFADTILDLHLTMMVMGREDKYDPDPETEKFQCVCVPRLTSFIIGQKTPLDLLNKMLGKEEGMGSIAEGLVLPLVREAVRRRGIPECMACVDDDSEWLRLDHRNPLPCYGVTGESPPPSKVLLGMGDETGEDPGNCQCAICRLERGENPFGDINAPQNIPGHSAPSSPEGIVDNFVSELKDDLTLGEGDDSQ